MGGMDLIEQAAQHLAQARRAKRRGERIPEAARPRDIETALAIQSRVSELMGEPVGGWKCSTPKPEKQILMAPIYASTIHRGAECPIIPRDGMALIEPEIAFVVGENGIAETRFVLELIGSRYETPEEATFPEMLADGLNGQGLVIGPVVEGGPADWMREFHIEIPGVFDGECRHPDGHPLAPFEWLQSYRPARPGQIVTTGSYAGIVRAPLNQPLRVRFADRVEMAVTFYRDSGA
jgi:2-keto-4-pentenoate hydratase